MSDPGAFETRFAAAYRRYLDHAPRKLDAAAVVRSVTAQPHRRAVAWPWTFRPLALRRAQVLLWIVLIALLLALFAAALFVGSRRPTLTFACPPGSTPNAPGSADHARPFAGGQGQSAISFDRRSGKLVAVTNATNAGTGVETWTFDVCTNTWTQMHPNQEPSSFGPQLVYDIDSDTTILFSSSYYGSTFTLWAYDLQANTWTERRSAQPPPNLVFLAYDPMTGLVVAAEQTDRTLMWTYDVGTDAWTPIRQANAGPDYFETAAFDASVDRLVVYGDGAAGSPPYETWLFDIRTGAWSRSAAERPAVVGWLTSPGIVYDEAAERTVVFMRLPLTAYDASTDRWAILAAADAVSPTLMAYDSVNRRLVGWGSGAMGPPGGAVEALDLVTGQWTILLEPLEE